MTVGVIVMVGVRQIVDLRKGFAAQRSGFGRLCVLVCWAVVVSAGLVSGHGGLDL